MKAELLKVIVQPVVIVRDPAGAIVGERIGESTAVYSLEQLAEFVEAVKRELERAPELHSLRAAEEQT